MNAPIIRDDAANRGRRGSVLLAALTVLSLAACGSGNSTNNASTDETPVGPGNSSGNVDGPESTVPDDVPDELDGEVGPLDVFGDALPLYDDELETDPAIGMTAPVLVGTDFAGNAVRVDAATDGPTMLIYLAHWCPHCNAEVPVINGLRDDGAFPEGLNIVAVSTAPRPDRPHFPPSEWINDVDWTYPVIVDGVDLEAGAFIGPAAYGLDAFPFVTLIDADGNVTVRWSGEAGADEITERISTYLGL